MNDELQRFVLRMAQDGLCVSSTFMRFDRRYATEHLNLARTSPDGELRELAARLLRWLSPGTAG